MRSLSLLEYLVIFRQDIVRWATRHLLSLNFSNSRALILGGRTKFGTKVSSIAPISFNALSPLIAFNLFSRSLYFCYAFVLSTWTTSSSCSLGSSRSCTNIGLMKLAPELTSYCPDLCTCPIDGVA